MDSFSVTKLNKTPSEVLDAAIRRPVELTERGRRKYVFMTADYYDKVICRGNTHQTYAIDELPSDLGEAFDKALDHAIEDTQLIPSSTLR